MTNTVNTRALVLEMLMAINEDGQYSHLVLRDVLDKYQYLSKQERAFLTRLTEGTVEKQITLDYVIDHFSKTKVRKMKPLIRNLMRLSVYQIMYMDGVPDSAVCNEAVKLARKRGFSGLSGFVNGVLRSIAREWKTVGFPNASVCYSVPEWIVNTWQKDYGKEQTTQILEALSTEAKLTVRTNLQKCTPQELKKRLEQLNKLKIHPRDLEENRLVLARAEKLHRETTGYIREQIDSRVQYFNYYLGRQDVLSINKGRKQLNLFLDYVEEQCLQEAAFEGTADGFSRWYESSKQAVDAQDQVDYRKEEQEYELWRGGHLTS